MSDDEEALSNLIAFMNHSQEEKGVWFIFTENDGVGGSEKRKKKGEGTKQKRRPYAFRDPNYGQQPSFASNKKQ